MLVVTAPLPGTSYPVSAEPGSTMSMSCSIVGSRVLLILASPLRLLAWLRRTHTSRVVWCRRDLVTRQTARRYWPFRRTTVGFFKGRERASRRPRLPPRRGGILSSDRLQLHIRWLRSNTRLAACRCRSRSCFTCVFRVLVLDLSRLFMIRFHKWGPERSRPGGSRLGWCCM